MDLLDLQTFLGDPDDENRVAQLHRQFAAILHARRCIQQKTTGRCTLSICPTWRNVLAHYFSCELGLKCEFEGCVGGVNEKLCAKTRLLIDHFQSCCKPTCRFCEPLRKSRKSTTTTCSQFTAYNASTSTCSSSSTYYEGTWSTGGCSDRGAFFSTYSTACSQQRQTRTFTSTYVRSPYGKTERIQRELIVMFHVQRCADLDRESKSVPRNIVCLVPHCTTMKRTLIHIAMCDAGPCDFPECEVTRSIIQHWIRCPKRFCDICCPVLSSIPAIDGDSDYEMDDKLLALLYTSTNGLMGIASSDLSSYESNLALTDGTVFKVGEPLGTCTKRKMSRDDELNPLSTMNEWKKKRL